MVPAGRSGLYRPDDTATGFARQSGNARVRRIRHDDADVGLLQQVDIVRRVTEGDTVNFSIHARLISINLTK